MIRLGKVVTAPIIMVENTKMIDIFNIVLENPELFIILIRKILNKNVIYPLLHCDLDTAAMIDYYLNPKNKEMFAILYIIMVTFHPDFSFHQNVIERSFVHDLQRITNIRF